ncbi:hypothetical protein [Paenibacillus humicola]|uniref:hypothetical protein n=1 Tax=Paenibacillus humicola TaxID=3110540 RepID=UPI00237BB820|nr:hypothetical protein [Paenibacillus humicola]
MVVRELKSLAILAIVMVIGIVIWAAIEHKKTSANDIVWLGKGKNWDYKIELVHKPNDQVLFLGGVPGGKPCTAPDYAVVVSEGLIYIGRKDAYRYGASFVGLPSFVSPASQMSSGDPNGLMKHKQLGTTHSACFTQEQWKRMKRDRSNTVKVTVEDEYGAETITLNTAR